MLFPPGPSVDPIIKLGGPLTNGACQGDHDFLESSSAPLPYFRTMQVSQMTVTGAMDPTSLLCLGGGNACVECASAAAGLWNDLDGDLLGQAGQV